MLLLTNGTTIEIVTTAALALDVTESHVDNNAGTITAGVTDTAITTAATTTVVATPTSPIVRNVQQLNARAKGAGSQTVTVQRKTGAAATELVKVTLLQDETLSYEQGQGFRVLDATGALKTASLGVGRFLRSVQVVASGNYTPGTGCKQVRVRMCGGGGGGGGTVTAATSAAVGGGGGAGAYLERTQAVSEGTAYACSIGAGGAGGAATGAVGTGGGSTTMTIGATNLSCPGGSGGTGGAAAAATALAVQGGAGGGTATAGDLNSGGQNGYDGERMSATVAWGGSGGDNPLGSGGRGSNAQGTGEAGRGKGGGGAGGATINGGAAAVGGAGIIGIILIDEYT